MTKFFGMVNFFKDKNKWNQENFHNSRPKNRCHIILFQIFIQSNFYCRQNFHIFIFHFEVSMKDMAKELLLVRHGVTEAPGFDKKDLKRDLIKPGIDQLERLSKLLKANGQICDHMAYSPANRCRQTALILSSTLEIRKSSVVNEIYQAGHGELLQVLNSFDNNDTHVIMVGHNPGVSHLAAFLTGEDHLLFSPGMMVRIAFYLDEWQHISKNSGALIEILQ